MEQVQPLHLGPCREIGDLAHAGVAPVHFAWILVVAERCIGDEQVGAAHEVRQSLDVLLVVARIGVQVELVVGDVADAAAMAGKPVAEAIAGMLEQQRIDRDRAESQGLLAQVAVRDARPEFADRDRKIHAVHLRRDRALYGEIPLERAEHLDLIAAHVQRTEEGDGVDMIPVRMRDEHPRRQPLHLRRRDVIGQLLHARAAVEDIQGFAANFHADAGRIAAIADGARSRHR
jgi:hypothetical protein